MRFANFSLNQQVAVAVFSLAVSGVRLLSFMPQVRGEDFGSYIGCCQLIRESDKALAIQPDHKVAGVVTN